MSSVLFIYSWTSHSVVICLVRTSMEYFFVVYKLHLDFSRPGTVYFGKPVCPLCAILQIVEYRPVVHCFHLTCCPEVETVLFLPFCLPAHYQC